MCKFINRSRSIVYEWRDKKLGEFSDILAQCMDNQHLELTNRGLKGDHNSAITKLMLTKHGYADKVDGTLGVTEVSHEDWLNSLDDE